MSIENHMPDGDNRRHVPDDFEDIIADHRSLGRTDDDIARAMGLSVKTLQRRFDRAGIPRGRRWRDIEDHLLGHAMSKEEARRIAGPVGTASLPGTTHPRRRAAS